MENRDVLEKVLENIVEDEAFGRIRYALSAFPDDDQQFFLNDLNQSFSSAFYSRYKKELKNKEEGCLKFRHIENQCDLIQQHDMRI